jgi:HEPN domain-containing protein
MSVEKFVANTLRIAKEDMTAARLLEPHDNRNAIYHCEQAAEKIIRAILTSEQKNAGPKHNLEELVDLVPDINPLKPMLRGLQELTIYATTYRYATPQGRIPAPPTKNEFSAAAKKVEDILAEVVKRFGVDLLRKDAPAQNPGPIR